MSLVRDSGRLARGARRVTLRKAFTVPRLLVAAWGALVLNVMAFGDSSLMVLPLPATVGKLITQAALPLALLLVLAANPRGVVLPNVPLLLLTVLAVVGLVDSTHNEFIVGSTYRACRYLAFVVVLWLLTPWWGRRDMLLLRCHRRVLWAVLGTVLVGAAVAPGRAFSFDGRLADVLWPILPTGVAHVAAVLFGTSVVLWMCHVITGRHAFVGLVLSGAVLVATHTRTAVAATLLGLVVSSLSLFVGHVRARRLSAVSALAAVAIATLFGSGLTTWAMRGQTAYQASQFTGRTTAWAAVFDAQRSTLAELFGSGLSNQSINGVPIDSSWVSTFYDLGVLGVAVQAAVFLVLIAMAVTHQRGPQRGVALFLISYVLVASLTESGAGTPSPYLLDLTVAASLLRLPARRSK